MMKISNDYFRAQYATRPPHSKYLPEYFQNAYMATRQLLKVAGLTPGFLRVRFLKYTLGCY